MEWISVYDEVPNEGQYVLMFGEGGRQFTALVKDAKFQAYNPFTEWLEDCEEVTHWMPLPEAPK